MVVALTREGGALEHRREPRVREEVPPDPRVAADRLGERAVGVGVVEVSLPDEDVGAGLGEPIEDRAELRAAGPDGHPHRPAAAPRPRHPEAPDGAHRLGLAAAAPRSPVDPAALGKVGEGRLDRVELAGAPGRHDPRASELRRAGDLERHPRRDVGGDQKVRSPAAGSAGGRRDHRRRRSARSASAESITIRAKPAVDCLRISPIERLPRRASRSPPGPPGRRRGAGGGCRAAGRRGCRSGRASAPWRGRPGRRLAAAPARRRSPRPRGWDHRPRPGSPAAPSGRSPLAASRSVSGGATAATAIRASSASSTPVRRMISRADCSAS